MAGLQKGVEHLLAIISSFSKEHIPPLCTAITKSENVVLEGEDHEGIYSFVALSAHYIGLNVTQCGASLQVIVKACKVLLKFVLLDLERRRDSHQPLKKQQVSIIEGLCKGHGCLNRTEIITLTAILKSANIFKDASNALAEKEIHFSFSQGEDFFQRLQTAFTESGEDHASVTKDKTRGDTEKTLTSESSGTDVKSFFSNCNVAALRQLGGGTVLLDLCLSLPEFPKVASKPAQSSSTVSLTSSSIQELSSELLVISSIISIPILEPLSSIRVENVCHLALGCLDVALAVATGNFAITGAAGTSGLSRPLSVKTPLGRLSLSKTSGAKSVSKMSGEEESLERCAQSIVENSINVFDVICGVISSSSRAGGQVLQNIHMLAAHRIINGLLSVLGLTPGSAKDNAAAKFKWLQGYNTLVVALASRGITLLSSLLDELQVEGLITDAEDEHVPVGADFHVNSPYSAWRRVNKLMHDLPLLNYLLAQFSTLYTMATSMIAPSVADKGTSRPSSGKSDSSKSPVTSSDEGDSEYISYSDGTVLQICLKGSCL